MGRGKGGVFQESPSSLRLFISSSLPLFLSSSPLQFRRAGYGPARRQHIRRIHNQLRHRWRHLHSPALSQRCGVLFDEDLRAIQSQQSFVRWQIAQVSQREPHRLQHDHIRDGIAHPPAFVVGGQGHPAASEIDPPPQQGRPCQRLRPKRKHTVLDWSRTGGIRRGCIRFHRMPNGTIRPHPGS